MSLVRYATLSLAAEDSVTTPWGRRLVRHSQLAGLRLVLWNLASKVLGNAERGTRTGR